MKTKQSDKNIEIDDFYKILGIDPKKTPTTPLHTSPESFYKELMDFSIYKSEGFKFSTSSSTSNQ